MSWWPHPLCQDNHKLHEVGKIMSQAIHEGSGCNSKFEQLTGSQKKPGMELMQLFWNSCNAMALQDQVPTICLKNLVEVLIVLVTPVSQIDMQCALIIVMAKVTVSFRSLTFWSLRAFPVAWLHNQAGCWPGSSPAEPLPEKKTTLYIPQNSWEKDFFSSIVSIAC